MENTQIAASPLLTGYWVIRVPSYRQTPAPSVASKRSPFLSLTADMKTEKGLDSSPMPGSFRQLSGATVPRSAGALAEVTRTSKRLRVLLNHSLPSLSSTMERVPKLPKLLSSPKPNSVSATHAKDVPSYRHAPREAVPNQTWPLLSL